MRLVTRSAFLAGASLVFFVSNASGATSDDHRSRGQGSLKWETRKSIQGPTSAKVGGTTLAVEVGADLDPVADVSKPLLSVDMSKGVVLEAAWNDDKSIDLVVIDTGTTDGAFKVLHTLAPHMKIYIDAFGFKLTYDYNAAALINYIPGSNWTYEGKGATEFAPWGFDHALAKVVPPKLADAQLFSMPIPAIAGSTPLTGTFSLVATTAPTFDYATTSAILAGGEAIVQKGGVTRIPTTDADYLEIPAVVKGEIAYKGILNARPAVTITKIGNFTLPLPLELDVPQLGVDLPYQSVDRKGIPVEFPSTVFHIPLPNVKAAKKLDVGSTELGRTIAASAEIQNTGEMDASAKYKSSDPQFVVKSTDAIKAKGKTALEVKFTPTAAGPQSAEIKVESNDPNEPTQIIKVTGNGTPREEEEPAPPGPPPPEGCGCRTAPSPMNGAAFAAGAIALGALIARRRRR
jgi:MYXO-CTERM domain-containing protein